VAAAKVLVQGVSKILTAARGPWPVKTGASLASLGFVLSGKEIRIVAIYYSPFILSRGVHPWDAYIAGPLAQFVRYEAPQQLAGEAIAMLAEGAHG
jgi:hypothetical protein